jgi:hypothetical protein
MARRPGAFRSRWAPHDARFHTAGVRHFHLAVVGELTLSHNRMDLTADHGLTISIYAARLSLPGGAEAPRQLGRHRRPYRAGTRARQS